MLEITEKYVSYGDEIRLHLRPDGGFIGGPGHVPLSPQHRIAYALKRKGIFRPSKFLNRTGSSVAMRMNGRNRVGDIVRMVLEEYDAPQESAVPIYDFIKNETQTGMASFHSEPYDSNFRVTGSQSYYYPTSLTLELTHRCNCRCKHCYLSAGEDNDNAKELPPESVVRILETLLEHGVITCEITGGEALMHPGFWDVLECISKHKALAAILTNGFLVTEKIASRIAEFDPAFIQVSLDGPNAEMHDTFRRAPGCFDAATRAIELFAQKTDAVLRVAMSVWPGNLHLMEETMEVGRRLGVDWFVFQPVTSNGRGLQDGEVLALNADEFAVFQITMRRLAAKAGPDVLQMILPKSQGFAPLFNNCGTAHTSLLVDPTGETRPCSMSPSDVSFGNLSTTSYEDVFSKTGRFARLPDPGGEVCASCQARMVCPPCVQKGIEAYSRMRLKGFESCRWGKEHRVGDILDELGWDMRSFGGTKCSHDSCGGIGIEL